jgi:hypothetical protein
MDTAEAKRWSALLSFLKGTFKFLVLGFVIGLLVWIVLILQDIRSLVDPRLPAFSVVHGFYYDPADNKKSGPRMILVDSHGHLLTKPMAKDEMDENKTEVPKPEFPGRKGK